MRKTKAGMTVKVTAIFALLYSFIFFPDIGAPPPAFALDSVFTDNVGIGTTAPAKTLDVAGDIRSTSLEVSGAGDANIGHDLYLSNSVSSQIYSNKALTIISGAVGQNLDLTLQGRGTGKVYVDDNLQATGTIRFSGLTSDGFVKTSGGDGTISVSSLGTGDLPSTVMLEGENISLLNNNSGFITDDTSVPKNHLTSSGTLGFTWGTGETAAKDTSDDAWTGTGNVYTTSGNVGIGTTTPLQSIGGGGSYSDWLGTHVKKDNYGIMVVEAGTRARLQLTDSNAAVDKKNFAIDVIDGLLEFNSVNDALTGSSQLIVVNPSGNVGIGYGNAGVAKLAINGNVGIGTTNPIASLDMGSGSIRLGGTTLSSWPTGADNLGNHIATQNLRMSGYWLSNDGGNEGVWVKSDGNVGVGTSSPIANLDIVNTGYTGLLVHGVENAAFRVKNDAGGGDFLDIQPATAGIDIQVNDSNVMRLSDANGNIGIGTTNPAQKLDVSGNIKSTGYGIFPTGIVPAATGAPDGKVFSPSGDYLASTTWGINYNEGSPDYIEFNNASAVTSRIALDDGSAHFALNGGNVGVGTNSPTAGYKLDVNGNLRVGGATLLIAETCCGTGLQMNNRAITGPDSIAFADTNEGITWTGGNTYIREMDAGYLSLYDGNAIVLEGSNVGIATTAPKHRLQIASSSNVTGLAFFTPTYDLSQQWGTRMYKSDTGGGIPLIVESQNTSTWYESARFDDGQTVGTHPSFQTRGHTYLAAITGNVGIGTTNPLSKLSIVGLSSGSQTTAVMTDGSGNLSTRALNSVAFNGETGLGTVTSVGLSAPAEFTVSGSPVTTSGTLTFSKANQNANLVYAGPSSGAAAAPAFRALVDNDIPDTITASNYLTTGGTAANANACSGDASCNVNSVLYPDSPSNYVLSQGNWGIYWNTADSGTYQNSYEFRGGGTTRHDLELGTGNAYFSIGAGNVGIGTTAPATQLSMPQTTSRLSWGTPLNNIYQLGVSGGGALLLGVNGDSEYIGFETHLSGNSHQERMRITEIGNVGIGTTAPLASLEVGGTGIRLGGVTRTTWPTDTDTNASTICNGSTTYLDGDGNCDTGYLDADGSDDDAPDSDGEVPDNISINNGNLYSISGSGNVGIGITNPGYKLDVSGDTRTSGMYYSTGSATDKFGNVNTSGWGVDALNTGNWDLLIYNGGDLYFKRALFGYGGAAAITTYDTNEDLSIDPNGSGRTIVSGYLGVGGTPGNTLYVEKARSDTISSTEAAYRLGGSDVYLFGGSKSSGSYAVWMQAFRPSDDAVFPLALNPKGGNVGIGTTSPGVTFDVVGGAIRTNNQLISTLGTGTAPLAVSSTTVVTNLNADTVDGQSYNSNWPTTLANIQSAATNDFHNIGGVDDDVPDTDEVSLAALANVDHGDVNYTTGSAVVENVQCTSCVTLGTETTGAYDSTDDAWTGTGDIYTTSGNVGIGNNIINQGGYTARVLTLYHGNAGGGYNSVLESTLDSQGAGKSTFGFYDRGASALNTIAKMEVTGANNKTGNFNFFTSNTGGTLSSVLFLRNDGTVGIGTTNPTAKLDIGGTTSTISNNSGNITITPASNLIISSGNLGVGTTAPLASLDVGGTGIRLGGTTRTTWPVDTDTNASTICNGSSTYLDGDGNCDTGYFDADGIDDDVPDTDEVSLAALANVDHGDVNYTTGSAVVENVQCTTCVTLGTETSGAYDSTNDSWTGTGDISMNTGSVGIGTTLASYKLDVQDTQTAYIRAKVTSIGDNNTASVWAENNAGDNVFISAANTSHLVNSEKGRIGSSSGFSQGLEITSGAGHINLLPSSNVGIGTASPEAKLHVNGGIKTGGLDSGGSIIGRYYSEFYQGVNLAMNSGNVGIGKSDPVYKLEVNGNGRFASTLLVDGYIRASDSSASSPTYSYTSDGNTGMYRIAEDKIGFATGGTGVMTVASGNVGIGTTNPQEELHVAQTSGNVAIRIGNFGSNDYQLVRSVGTDFSAGYFGIQNVGIATPRLVIDTNGNVGISTTNPGYKLDVVDDVRIGAISPGHASGSPDLFVQGNLEVDATAYFDGPLITAGNASIGGGTGKLDVGTVDPIYDIAGEKFATYMAGMIGIKEEATGIIRLENAAGSIKAVIDFDGSAKGSDLWLFGNITEFGNDWENLVIILTPSFNGNIWYEKDIANKKLIIHSDKEGEVSFRFTAPRFDHAAWPNTYGGTQGGLKVR